MTILAGKGVCGGYAFGRIAFLRRNDTIAKRYHVNDVDEELHRFEKARDTATAQLADLYKKALTEVGETNAQIFDIHQMMLEDEDYLDSVKNIISNQKMNAEYAVAVTADNFAEMLRSMDDEYMRERAADVKDISERVIRALAGVSGNICFDSPVVLAADDLAPSETVQLDKSKIIAFVTAYGSANSHTAILSRMMNIPAVIGLGEEMSDEWDGHEVIVDGFDGKLYIDPDPETRADFEKRASKEAEKKRHLQQLKGKENVTLDGQEIEIFANIGGIGDVDIAMQNDAGGIGLFRSEFLYLQASDYPSEDEQFRAYKAVAESMAGRKVVIRTLDIGADKQIDYFGLDKEENPALGFRAIRICLDRPEIFKTQLRALYRASAFGKIAIMLPMITDVEEVREAKRLISEVCDELSQSGIAYDGNVELGIMVETPASVMVSDQLAKEVSFFSVGTNDLTQYTLAVDRQNPKLDRFCRPHHKGLLRMLKIAADSIHNENGWIGICGELAADTRLTETFLAIGIDELSVSPEVILQVREKVRSINISKVREKIISDLSWENKKKEII